jgi:formylglycine-generating enzyme required for sulfatase activity
LRAGLLLVGLVGGAVTVALLMRHGPTPDGLVRIECDDPAIRVAFGKAGPVITGADKQPIVLGPGPYGLSITRGDVTFEADQFVLKQGESVTLKVVWQKGQVQLLRNGEVFLTRDVPARHGTAAPAHGARPKAYRNESGMEFVLVPQGKSWLGGGDGKPGPKEVEFAYDFYMGKYAVTQAEWEKLMGSNPSRFSHTGDDKESVKELSAEDLQRFPVEMVSWRDAQAFLARLNQQLKEGGWDYRLPRLDEWEYACRGGPLADRADSAFDFYLDQPAHQLLPSQANFNGVLSRPCPVGSYQPNRLGLFDMHGNIAVICEIPTPGGEPAVVSRGGGWVFDAGECRAAHYRPASPDHRAPDYGLRLVRVPAGK